MNKLIFITLLKIVYIRSDNDEEVENVVEFNLETLPRVISFALSN